MTRARTDFICNCCGERFEVRRRELLHFVLCRGCKADCEVLFSCRREPWP